MNSFASIIRADYLQRTRSNIFLATLLASIYAAYSFVPIPTAAYCTVRIGNYVGYNNAAWIGHVTAIMASTFMWFIGYYLINNGIRRDVESGVGQIIAATSISNFMYLLAKAFTNFLILLTITCMVIVMALWLVLVRGTEYHFNVIQFLHPYLFATIPSIFFLSAIAVFFEIIFGKRTNLSNISFFVFFSALVGYIYNPSKPLAPWTDVLGIKYLLTGIENVANGVTGIHNGISVGYNFGSKREMHYFLFEGTHLNTSYLMCRLLWIAMAFALLWISSLLFRRFDARTFSLHALGNRQQQPDNQASPVTEMSFAPLPEAMPDNRIFPLIKAEILMLLRKGPKWFWLINLGLYIALFFTPLDKAHQILLPIIWFVQVNRWSDISTKEKYYGTSSFVFVSSRPLTRILTAQILAGTLTALAFSFPVMLRYMFRGGIVYLPGIVLGAALLIVMSTGLGILTRGKRVYEVLYFMLTYAVLEKVPQADYFGGQYHTPGYFAIQVLIIAIFLATTYLARKYEIRHQ